jgi:hypothetical protein
MGALEKVLQRADRGELVLGRRVLGRFVAVSFIVASVRLAVFFVRVVCLLFVSLALICDKIGFNSLCYGYRAH